jgi:hypothetical protein
MIGFPISQLDAWEINDWTTLMTSNPKRNIESRKCLGNEGILYCFQSMNNG